MKFLNNSKSEICEENLINELLEKSKSQILDGKTSLFENILQKSKHKYRIV